VAAVIASAVALTGNQNHIGAADGGHTLPLMPGRELRFAVTVGPVAGYDVANRYLVADREATDVARSDNEGVGGEVVAYPPGGYDPTAVRRGQQVSVQGHTGYFANTPQSADAVDHVPNQGNAPTLAWEFAPDRWVVIQGWDPTTSPQVRKLHVDPLTEELHVAAAVDTSADPPLLLPYRVGYLPDGLSHGGGRATAVGKPYWDSYLWFLGPGQSPTDPDPAHPALAITAQPTVSRPASSSSASTPSARVQHNDSVTRRTVAPSGGDSRQNEVTVRFGTVVVTITGDYPRAELIKIGRSITIASNPNDASTWFDATK